ncbi:MAG: CoA-acylating methylmalonate-semialdehyde dehydrogenase [Actinobacteria bacterium]|nr:CoA-acylating methylmalonate-semialdehyde dehydrogenase [Actinomycetota bacterium]
MNATQIATQPRHLIAGEWAEGGGEPIEVFDPATGTKTAELRAATPAQVDEAVAAAAAAFPAWSALSLSRRVGHVQRMKAAVEANAEELAELIVLDQGKTLAEAKGEIQRAVEFIDSALAAPMLFHSDNGNIAAGLDVKRIREPLGVCAAVTPFNFPVMNPSQFSAWALVCGNTLVVKASEQDPIASTRLFELFRESGLPSGVLSLVHGKVETVQRLITHPDVAAVSCITSSPTAKAIYEAASGAGKRVQANGGAKNPIVVMPDADLDVAADGVVTSCFGMAGQRCLAASRLVTVGDVHDELLAKVVERAEAIVVGGGGEEGTTMGPVVSAASKARVEDTIAKAVEKGAEVILDGRGVSSAGGDAHADGYFIGPSILTGLSTADELERQETFGPLLVVHRAGDLDEAIGICNDTEFGNAAAVFTASGSTAREFEHRCRAGNVGINAFPAPPANVTMGGYGTSFYGDLHICGAAPLEFYTDNKMVVSRW